MRAGQRAVRGAGERVRGRALLPERQGDVARTRGDTWLLTLYTSLQEVQTVAVDGSVFKHHPLMKQRMSYYINKFAHPKKVDRCQIMAG